MAQLMPSKSSQTVRELSKDTHTTGEYGYGRPIITELKLDVVEANVSKYR